MWWVSKGVITKRSNDIYTKSTAILTFIALDAALTVRIARVAAETIALRQMGDHLTFGVRSAKSRTRILALLAQAGPVRCAIRMHQTFWPAHLVRIAGVLG